MKRILICEDDEILRLGIKTLLSKFNVVVEEAKNGSEAIELLEEKSYHLVITDIMMPEVDGFGVVKYIKDHNLNPAIICISAMNDECTMLNMYDLNIIEYITKPINLNILEKKLNVYFNILEIEDKDDIKFNYQTNKVLVFGEEIDLTKKEFELLELLYSFSPQIFSKYDLLNEIWYGNMNMSEKIVEVTILNIRKKLKDHKDLIKTHRNLGYSFEK